MTESTSFRPSVPAPSSRDALTEVLQRGARKLLETALPVEVQAYLDAHAGQLYAAGRRLVVRNGYLPERGIQTGIGPVPVRQPRVRDKREGRRAASRAGSFRRTCGGRGASRSCLPGST